jgi:hypothetical protein
LWQNRDFISGDKLCTLIIVYVSVWYLIFSYFYRYRIPFQHSCYYETKKLPGHFLSIPLNITPGKKHQVALAALYIDCCNYRHEQLCAFKKAKENFGIQ